MVCHYLTDLHKSQIKDSLIRVLFYWFRLVQKMANPTEQKRCNNLYFNSI